MFHLHKRHHKTIPVVAGAISLLTVTGIILHRFVRRKKKQTAPPRRTQPVFAPSYLGKHRPHHRHPGKHHVRNKAHRAS